jgi:hypothetical protein
MPLYCSQRKHTTSVQVHCIFIRQSKPTNSALLVPTSFNVEAAEATEIILDGLVPINQRLLYNVYVRGVVTFGYDDVVYWTSTQEAGTMLIFSYSVAESTQARFRLFHQRGEPPSNDTRNILLVVRKTRSQHW